MLLDTLLETSAAHIRGAVIVAHPDDETLWAGGTILMYPHWDWFIFTLCRASDRDRSRRFHHVLGHLDARGKMADLDDGPAQNPLPGPEIERTILENLPRQHYEVILTHGPQGEYTDHRRHEEVSAAVLRLWCKGKISTDYMLMFAYEDGQRRYLPQCDPDAHIKTLLPTGVWQEKHHIVTDLYGFAADSWEAQTAPRQEAFWCFDSAEKMQEWFTGKGGLR